MRTRHLLPIAAAALLACGEGAPPESGTGRATEPAGEPVTPVETRPLTEGLALWRAEGFTLLVPEDADIVPQDPEPPETWYTILAGPGFVQEIDGQRVPGPPAYRIDAATYAKPDTAAFEEWVAARLAERGDAAAQGILVALAGEPALRTGAPPGESGATSYWLERGGKVVELRLTEEPESPLEGIQRHLQALILSTFRWSEASPGP